MDFSKLASSANNANSVLGLFTPPPRGDYVSSGVYPASHVAAPDLAEVVRVASSLESIGKSK
jgi:hypothetical protein